MSVERATIFLAHSSLDIKEARQVRNLFEDLDHDVLLLKLSQKMTESYLRELLGREIQARDWLVMLRSENAGSSAWVGFEQQYARERGKPIFEIDLQRCRALGGEAFLSCLNKQVAGVSRDIRVFLSYGRPEAGLAARLRNDLIAQGYEVWLDVANLEAGASWQDQIVGAIDRTLAKGAVVLLLSKASVTSRYVMREVEYALNRSGRVIPCLVGPEPNEVPLSLANIHWVNFTASYERGLTQLITALGRKQAATRDEDAA